MQWIYEEDRQWVNQSANEKNKVYNQGIPLRLLRGLIAGFQCHTIQNRSK